MSSREAIRILVTQEGDYQHPGWAPLIRDHLSHHDADMPWWCVAAGAMTSTSLPPDPVMEDLVDAYLHKINPGSLMRVMEPLLLVTHPASRLGGMIQQHLDGLWPFLWSSPMTAEIGLAQDITSIPDPWLPWVTPSSWLACDLPWQSHGLRFQRSMETVEKCLHHHQHLDDLPAMTERMVREYPEHRDMILQIPIGDVPLEKTLT